MALDLFCYSSRLVSDVDVILNNMRMDNKEIFDEKYFISKALLSNHLPEDIFIGDGLVPCSLFLVSLNDKDAFHLLDRVEGVIKKSFHEGEILILLNNEILR